MRLCCYSLLGWCSGDLEVPDFMVLVRGTPGVMGSLLPWSRRGVVVPLEGVLELDRFKVRRVLLEEGGRLAEFEEMILDESSWI